MDYLAGPAHALPDTEVADDPGEQQGQGQLPPDVARVLQAVRDLQCIAPANSRDCARIASRMPT